MVPTCSVAGKAVDNGANARCFAQYMRIHALEATGGLVYSEMGQYLDASGKPTSDKTAAAIDPATKKPVPNAARNTWVTETALGTALNTSYFAENVALFSIVMGAAAAAHRHRLPRRHARAPRHRRAQGGRGREPRARRHAGGGRLSAAPGCQPV